MHVRSTACPELLADSQNYLEVVWVCLLGYPTQSGPRELLTCESPDLKQTRDLEQEWQRHERESMKTSNH